MTSLEEQLKNPVWYSLKETHKHFLVEYDGVQFYNQEVSTFGSFFDETKTVKASNNYLKNTDHFFFVSENQTPLIDDTKVFLEKKIEGCQMVLNTLSDVSIIEEIVLLGNDYIDEIYNLIWLVMPGYYRRRTYEMGNYYGIFKNGKLVSITGQRMQTNLFIEVSAVVTHPEYTRKGFAKQLIAHTTKEILRENKKPILHTNKGNSAIPLYEKLGYELTRDMNWWLYRKV
ncbi:GNAT family N-acetyltransferase [Maribacter hydrothermalis]|uniref:Acetyltransferase n=1 Tax=Maribacter hydrothermalis TaxID=1836467 RepID=A0A1B7ZF01_9FLAO|nr:GNAT family N-acetyltransferase [Maribacter hydrothermalis]APQ17639.1 GNAT family N-acetyltransferase [Maribacter hydrothermalis]OBR42114.1 acetyltransferase [Maribacter hydrothermalis]